MLTRRSTYYINCHLMLKCLTPTHKFVVRIFFELDSRENLFKKKNVKMTTRMNNNDSKCFISSSKNNKKEKKRNQEGLVTVF